jgi:transposase
VGPERLERIMGGLVGRLRDAGVVKGDIVACDTTFIKASVTQRMTLEAIAIQTLGLRRAIGSATSST